MKKRKKLSSFVLLFICMSSLFIYSSCNGTKKRVSYKNFDDFRTINSDFRIKSEAVINGKLLPAYQCEEKINGVENSIPLAWEGVPKGTKSLAIVMYHYPHKEDKTEVNSYLLLWNIPPSVTDIPYKLANDPRWCMGPNKDGVAISYTSPCSRGPGRHKYTIALFALGQELNSLPDSSSVNVDYTRFMEAISKSQVIDRTSLSFIVTTE